MLMLKIEQRMSIVTLWKSGKSQREIAKILKVNRRSVSKIIKQYQKDGNIDVLELKKKKILDSYKDQIISYLEKDLSGVRIYEELLKEGSNASYRTVCEYISHIKKKKKICIRFNTEAGQEAQVDFGYIGLMPDGTGQRRKAWVFNMRLSYSRLDYYEVVFDQKVSTFINCHSNAFNYFGGVPKTVKVDNLKAAIISANFYEPVQQDIYRQYGEHYGFDIIACRVMSPQEKGKVESGIKYVKNNFFAGRDFTTLQELKSSLSDWLEYNCNSRIHGTTRKIPFELFKKEEKDKLNKLPLESFSYPEILRRKVCKDCHITVDYNYYSVPYAYVGKIVDIVRERNFLRILYSNKEIALHIRNQSKGEFITNDSHYPKYKNFDSTEWRGMYKDKMSKIGNYAEKIFNTIIVEHPNSWYRTISGLLSLKKLYSNEVLELSFKRALSFNITSYSKIKNICKSGAYNLPNDYIGGCHE